MTDVAVTLPAGYYALEVWDHDREDADGGPPVIGYQAMRVKADGRPGRLLTFGLVGCDWGAIQAYAHDYNTAVAWIADDPAYHGWLFARHTGRCFKCNRALTDPKSVTDGIGPECARRFA
ncbi:MAG TPA: DUF6011 domain-containing protein [Rugosimonospora sp.]|nr:DUF6011 domain-containing protein [Rugosimonospora sp.]